MANIDHLDLQREPISIILKSHSFLRERWRRRWHLVRSCEKRYNLQEHQLFKKQTANSWFVRRFVLCARKIERLLTLDCMLVKQFTVFIHFNNRSKVYVKPPKQGPLDANLRATYFPASGAKRKKYHRNQEFTCSLWLDPGLNEGPLNLPQIKNDTQSSNSLQFFP